MNNAKKIIILLIILCLMVACSRGDRVKNGHTNTESNNINNNEGNSLQDEAIAKKVADVRNQRDSYIKEKDGLIYGRTTEEQEDLMKDMPNINRSKEENELIFGKAEDYVRNVLKIEPKTKMVVYTCVDPNILKLYKTDNKGVLKGYSNENIEVCEYQKEDGSWSYIFIARKDKNSPWEVVHEGDSYLEE